MQTIRQQQAILLQQQQQSLVAQQQPSFVVFQDPIPQQQPAKNQDEFFEDNDEDEYDDFDDDDMNFANEDGMELSENQMLNSGIVDIDKDTSDVRNCCEYALPIFALLRQDEVRLLFIVVLLVYVAKT